ncbi:MAG: hypothetical protein U0075_12690 [Thermomicrobiales bacterium]
MSTTLLGHLLADHWQHGELLLYGGAGVGLVSGLGLFLWGRHERHAPPPPQPTADVSISQGPLLKRS